MQSYLLAIDQGTTNSRAIVFNAKGELISQHEIPLTQSFPHPGWVEQNPDEMFANTVACCKTAIKKANLTAKQIKAVGITNQRETTIIWDKKTGKPIYPAIVWQDRRTGDLCTQLAKTEINANIQKNTGLRLDPYFSATKIMWLLDNIPNARKQAENGDLLFGTVDTYLLWKLTEGKVHATDVTNASRTMLYNIRTLQWDDSLLKALKIPAVLLPEVKDNAHHFGDIAASLLGAAIPIMGMAGDQQAATIGQACFSAGMIKATYGTGCFILVNTGSKIQTQEHLLSTIAYRINKEVTYGIEGSIFSAGVVVKWLRDSLHLIQTAAETEELARSVTSTEGVYLVPAFTGLGAPYWDPNARGALLGLTRVVDRAHIVRAALECIVYQTLDLLNVMPAPENANWKTLRVDGGMAANNWLLQFLADLINFEVQKPTCIETTALGVAYLAGLQTGIFHSLSEISELWQQDLNFNPQMSDKKRELLYSGWKKALTKVVS